MQMILPGRGIGARSVTSSKCIGSPSLADPVRKYSTMSRPMGTIAPPSTRPNPPSNDTNLIRRPPDMTRLAPSRGRRQPRVVCGLALDLALDRVLLQAQVLLCLPEA